MKNTKKRLTQEQKDQIKAMRKDGMTQKAIAEKIGCSTATVQKCLKNDYEPKTQKVCVVCGKTFEVAGKLNWVTCRNRACVEEHRKRLRNSYYKDNIKDKIRPYTETSNMMIISDLDQGRDVHWMAEMYDRDVDDLKKHIDKIIADGTTEKLSKRLAAYQKYNTLRGGGFL